VAESFHVPALRMDPPLPERRRPPFQSMMPLFMTAVALKSWSAFV
jgi:hypothetical protein